MFEGTSNAFSNNTVSGFKPTMMKQDSNVTNQGFNTT